jgi:hypothetical protein
MDDPNLYRGNSARCIELANATTDTVTQNSLFEMAKAWMLLAEHSEILERGHAIRVRWRGNGAEKSL